MNEINSSARYMQQILECQRDLYVFILKLVPRRADADEVLQESNVVLLSKAAVFEPGTDFGAWSRQIARFQVKALRQRQGRDRLRFSDELLDTFAGENSEVPLVRLAQSDALDRCVDRLGQDDRHLLNLRYVENLCAPQIAKKVGRKVNAVYQLLFRIRTGLAQCVQQRMAREEQR